MWHTDITKSAPFLTSLFLTVFVKHNCRAFNAGVLVGDSNDGSNIYIIYMLTMLVRTLLGVVKYQIDVREIMLL